MGSDDWKTILMNDRKIILLKACYDMLSRLENDPAVVVFYGGESHDLPQLKADIVRELTDGISEAKRIDRRQCVLVDTILRGVHNASHG